MINVPEFVSCSRTWTLTGASHIIPLLTNPSTSRRTQTQALWKRKEKKTKTKKRQNRKKSLRLIISISQSLIFRQTEKGWGKIAESNHVCCSHWKTPPAILSIITDLTRADRGLATPARMFAPIVVFRCFSVVRLATIFRMIPFYSPVSKVRILLWISIVTSCRRRYMALGSTCVL